MKNDSPSHRICLAIHSRRSQSRIVGTTCSVGMECAVRDGGGDRSSGHRGVTRDRDIGSLGGKAGSRKQGNNGLRSYISCREGDSDGCSSKGDTRLRRIVSIGIRALLLVEIVTDVARVDLFACLDDLGI